jgi:hypothetical protein
MNWEKACKAMHAGAKITRDNVGGVLSIVTEEGLGTEPLSPYIVIHPDDGGPRRIWHAGTVDPTNYNDWREVP